MGAGTPPPFEGIVVLIVWALAIALSLGAMTAGAWSPPRARLARRGALALAVVVQAAFHILAPPRSGIESAARLVFLWPAAALALLAAAAWAWRDGRRARGAIP